MFSEDGQDRKDLFKKIIEAHLIFLYEDDKLILEEIPFEQIKMMFPDETYDITHRTADEFEEMEHCFYSTYISTYSEAESDLDYVIGFFPQFIVIRDDDEENIELCYSFKRFKTAGKEEMKVLLDIIDKK